METPEPAPAGLNCTRVLEHLASCTELAKAEGMAVPEHHAGSLADVILPPVWVTVVATFTIVAVILSTRWLFTNTVKRVWVFENLERSRHRRLILPPSAVVRPRELERAPKSKSKLTYTKLSARTRALLTPTSARKRQEEYVALQFDRLVSLQARVRDIAAFREQHEHLLGLCSTVLQDAGQVGGR